MTKLTPETQIFLEGLKNLQLPTADQIPPQILRDQYETAAAIYGGEPLDEIAFEDLNFLVSGKNIKTRHYKHTFQKHTILYAHGGGWTRGSLSTHHVMCQKLAKSTACELIAIDYSLAPENPYPTALNEIESIYLEVIKNNKLPITIAGDSAGANLMASLMVKLNANNAPIPERAIFFYPSFGLTGTCDSLKEFSEGYLLTQIEIDLYVKNYIGNNIELKNSPYVSPLLAMSEITFPKTLIIAARCDPIRDDSRNAKKILERKNLLMSYLEVPGVIHGFAQFPSLFPEAEMVFEWIKKNYH